MRNLIVVVLIGLQISSVLCLNHNEASHMVSEMDQPNSLTSCQNLKRSNQAARLVKRSDSNQEWFEIQMAFELILVGALVFLLIVVTNFDPVVAGALVGLVLAAAILISISLSPNRHHEQKLGYRSTRHITRSWTPPTINHVTEHYMAPSRGDESVTPPHEQIPHDIADSSIKSTALQGQAVKDSNCLSSAAGSSIKDSSTLHLSNERKRAVRSAPPPSTFGCDIYENWNDTEKISMAPCERMTRII
ncbi:hypothetical protein SeLEV6574_g01594 [Synchytrium endobioticum]|uniref:TRP C-terminal domain-containing protein n=2 Tax=Synchytrium endobioticum TaxID=286115 RepID=A0A507DD79_9FUNG|nr:hypothetical protein SeLEV6574_g01594 [Synchytrium endobioticum]